MTLPDFNNLRAGEKDCPSDFALDRLFAGELAKNEAQPIEAHVAGCQHCGSRMAERRAGFDAVPGLDSRQLLAKIRTGAADESRDSATEGLLKWIRRLLAPVAVIAAASVLFVVNRGSEQPGLRTKGGGPTLHVYRLAGDRAEETLSGARFVPGDKIRFAADLPADGAVGIVGVEPNGNLYKAWPLDGAAQTRFEAGTGVELPGAVQLDQSKGQETLYMVLCPDMKQVPRCQSRGPGAAPDCTDACKLSPFTLEKQ